MKKIFSLMIKKCFILILASFFVFWPVYSFADENNTNNSGENSAIVSTGSATPTTGPTTPTGPQGPTGPHDQSDQSVTQSMINSETGPSSDNQNQNDSTSDTSVAQSNQSDTQNNANLKLDTGGNSVGANSVVGGVNTGDIEGSVSLINLGGSQLSGDSTVGNSTLDGSTLKTGLNLGSSAIQNTVPLTSLIANSQEKNQITGANSTNLNAIDSQNTVGILSDNQTNTANTINIDANSGQNDLLNNTKAGVFSTGDINLAVNLINLANLADPNLTLNLNLLSIEHGLNGNIVIPDISNLATGTNSLNQNTTNANSSTDATIANNSNVENVMNIHADSGNNQIINNSVVGDTKSGDTRIDNHVANISDASDGLVFYIINVFGKWLGTSLLPAGGNFIVNQFDNSTSVSGGGPAIDNLSNQSTGIGPETNLVTGTDSLNQNNINNSSSTNIDEDNQTNIQNKININANTGKNKVMNNTLVSAIQTGSINVLSNVVNVLNSFGRGLGKIKLGIINIFGDWNGNLADHETAPVAETETTTQSSSTQITTSNSVDSASLDTQVAVNDTVVTNSKKSRITTPVLSDIANISPLAAPNAVLDASVQPLSGTNFPYKLLIIIPATIIGVWLAAEILVRRVLNRN